MTREEAIEFIAQSVKSDVDMAKVADAIKALEQEPRWIPVSERLPEESGDYLVTICYDLIGKGTVREIRRDIFYISTKRWLYEGDDVIAWMPLPKPYKPQESEG